MFDKGLLTYLSQTPLLSRSCKCTLSAFMQAVRSLTHSPIPDFVTLPALRWFILATGTHSPAESGMMSCRSVVEGLGDEHGGRGLQAVGSDGIEMLDIECANKRRARRHEASNKASRYSFRDISSRCCCNH